MVPGIGSGVATYALFMAKAIGATVSVTSRSEEEKKKGAAIRVLIMHLTATAIGMSSCREKRQMLFLTA